MPAASLPLPCFENNELKVLTSPEKIGQFEATQRHLEGLSKALFNHSFKPYLYGIYTVYIRFIRRMYLALCKPVYTDTDTDTDTVASTNIRPYIYGRDGSYGVGVLYVVSYLSRI